MNEALRDWVTNVRTTHYVIGSVAGPHPYPMLVRELQAVIGREARVQIQEAEGRLPDALVACVGGGSNAIGLFHCVRSRPARGALRRRGGRRRHRHRASRGDAGARAAGRAARRPLVRAVRRDGQIAEAHSISAGLDYPGVGPEHAFLKDTGRAKYLSVTDSEALAGFQRLARTEGILCALESAHAIAALPKVAATLPDGAVVDRQRLGPGRQGHGDHRLAPRRDAVSSRLGTSASRARRRRSAPRWSST